MKEPKHKQHSIFKFILIIPVYILLFFTLSFNAAIAVEIDPDLLNRFTLIEENQQTVVVVGMADLLTLALERATNMDIIAIEKRIAEEAYLAAKEIYSPTLSMSVLKSRSVSPSGTNISGNVLNPYTRRPASFLSFQASDATVLSTQWSKRLKTGIAYNISYEKTSSQTSTAVIAEEGDSLDGWNTYDDPVFVDSITAGISVPFFQDWGEVNKMPELKSRVGLEQTRYSARKSELELLNMVGNIYWDLVEVQENISTLKASKMLAEQFVEDAKIKHELGVLDPIEVKQGESQLLQVKQNLLREEFRKRLIEDQIKVALNLEDIPYGYKATEKMKIRKAPLDIDLILRDLYTNNKDIALLESQFKLSSLQLKEAENKAKSNVDLNLQYTMNGYGNTIASSTAEIAETKLHDYTIGLTWSIPLFDKMTPQLIQQRKLEQSKIALQIENVKAQLKVELQSIFRNLRLALEGIELARASVDLTRELLRKETEKFKLGNTTSFRVAQVQQDLTDAQKNETLAKIQYEKIYLMLLIKTERIYDEYSLEKS